MLPFARSRTSSQRSRSPIQKVRDLPLIPAQYVPTFPTPKNAYTSTLERRIKAEQINAQSLPVDWLAHVHPRGWLYYSNPVQRLVSNFHMEFGLGQQEFERAIKESGVIYGEDLPDHCELWVDYEIYDKKEQSLLLYVDHKSRNVSRIRPSQTEGLKPPDPRDTEENIRIRLKNEQKYWEYIIDHPCHHQLGRDAIQDTIAALTWYATDKLLNPEESLAPFEPDMSQQLLEILRGMIDDSDHNTFSTPQRTPIKTHFVATILERVAGERVSQHYGHWDSRTYLRKRLAGLNVEDAPRPFLIRLLIDFTNTFVLFGVPKSYLRHTNEFFIRGLGRTESITQRWRSFVQENVDDWTNSNLVSAVLVSAAVAFLAVPGIDELSRILGIASTLFAIASIITGLLNVWQHTHISRTNLEITVIFDFFSETMRTDILFAILLSLPLVLLIWSALTFAASIVAFAFKGLDPTFVDSKDPNDLHFNATTHWITLGLCALLTASVLYSFWFFRRAWNHPTRRFFSSILSRPHPL